MSLPGKLIVFEGVDGVGKTTLARKLAEHFSSINVSCKYFAFPGREIGTLGYHVYLLHHDLRRFGITSVSPTSLQVLHIAAHIDAIEQTIVPALKQSYYVILDRFWWSTWVYGLVNGVHFRSIEAMVDLELIHWSKIVPDVVFLISRPGSSRDHVSTDQRQQLEKNYQELAEREAKKYRVELINNDASLEETFRLLISTTHFTQNRLTTNG